MPLESQPTPIKERLQQELLIDLDLGLLLLSSLRLCPEQLRPINYLLPVVEERSGTEKRVIAIHSQTGDIWVNQSNTGSDLAPRELDLFLQLYHLERETPKTEKTQIHLTRLRKLIKSNIQDINLKTKYWGKKVEKSWNWRSVSKVQPKLIDDQRFPSDLYHQHQFLIDSKSKTGLSTERRIDYFRGRTRNLDSILELLSQHLPKKGIDSSKVDIFSRSDVSVQLNKTSGDILRQNQHFSLTKTEKDFFLILLSDLGLLVSSQEMERRLHESYGRFYNFYPSGTRNVAVNINSIRTKLDNVLPGMAKIVEVKRGLGYRFNIEYSGLLGQNWLKSAH